MQVRKQKQVQEQTRVDSTPLRYAALTMTEFWWILAKSNGKKASATTTATAKAKAGFRGR
jgi:hypothetical protein